MIISLYYGLSNINNGDGGCGLTAQIDWLGLRVGGHKSIPIRDLNRFVKKSDFRFTSCHAVFALNK